MVVQIPARSGVGAAGGAGGGAGGGDAGGDAGDAGGAGGAGDAVAFASASLEIAAVEARPSGPKELAVVAEARSCRAAAAVAAAATQHHAAAAELYCSAAASLHAELGYSLYYEKSCLALATAKGAAPVFHVMRHRP